MKQRTETVTPLFYAYMKKVAETSNNNLIRNSSTFLASGGKVDPDSKFEWVDSSLEETKKKNSNVLTLAHPADYGYVIPRRFTYWKFLPTEFQSKFFFYV